MKTTEQKMETKLKVKKEAGELAKACGYIAGEISEVLENGVGVEDISSAMELAQNYPMIKDGFDIKVKMTKENLGQLEQADLIEIIMLGFQGFNEGKK